MKTLVLMLVLVGGLAMALRAAPAQEGEGDAATRQYVYKKTPKGDLAMTVHFPPGWKAAEARPAVVFFFGGGWTGGTINQFADQAAYLASRGMVAARADYRVKSRQGVTPDACVEDAKSAVRWLRQKAGELGIDPNRIVGAGGSAGGHIAACAAMTPGLDAKGEDASVSSKPNALVLFNPVLDLQNLGQHAAGLGDDTVKAISPNLHVAKDTPAAVLFYGTKDKFLAHGQAMLAKSKEAGNRVELWTADGQPHTFFNRPPWKQLTLIKADEFLVSLGYLKGKPTVEAPAGTTVTLKKVE